MEEQISKALAAQARSGNREAMGELYRASYPELWRTVRALVRSRDEVQDILQDAYVKAFSRMDQLRANEAVLPWLKRIAVNTARDHLKQGRPLLFSELEKAEGEAPLARIPETDAAALPEQALDRKESARLVQALLDSLTDAQRAVMGLYYYEEMSVREIAETLEIPENTVKWQLRDGRRKLEARLRDLEREGEWFWGLTPLALFRAIPEPPEPPAGGAVLPVRALSGGAVLTRRLLAGLGAALLLGGGALGLRALLGRSRDPAPIPTRPPVTAPAETPEPMSAEPPATETPAPEARVIPADYDHYDYNKLADFLDQTDEAGVRNGEKVDPAYTPNDPATWGSTPSVSKVVWTPQDDGLLHLTELQYSAYDPDKPFAGGLDLSGCAYLEKLWIFGGLTELRLDGCRRLSEVTADDNSFGDLTLRDCPALTSFCANDSRIRSLTVENCPGLEDLTLWRNELTEIDLSGTPGLVRLCVMENKLTEIDLTGLPGLEDLDLRYNEIAALDLTPCPAVVSLLVNGNPFTELDLSPCPELRNLDCNSLEIHALDLSGCEKLETLCLAYNHNLTQLDLTRCPSLRQLDISDTPLTALDLSRCPALESVTLQGTKISALDLSGKKALSRFSAYGNPLTKLELAGCDRLQLSGVRVEGVGTLDVQLSNSERCHVQVHPGLGWQFLGWYAEGGRKLDPLLHGEGEMDFYVGSYDSIVALLEQK
ncbi:MAG: sigma-70 family RNA polymerase sigma factor [Oscillospiraceae bacterium]|nr:sigma-70 family RNA polymerase sigma factor [Oscillospiraceae bacterium]